MVRMDRKIGRGYNTYEFRAGFWNGSRLWQNGTWTLGIPGRQAGMRIVLRKIKTGLFLRPTGEWTTDLSVARTFKHSAEAMDTARKQGLEGLEVLLAFEEPTSQRQVAIPLP